MEVISPKIIDDQRDAESFKEEGASSSNLVSPSENVTRKSTDENDSAADKKSSTELLKESALVLNSNEPELSETYQKNQNDEMPRNEIV